MREQFALEKEKKKNFNVGMCSPLAEMALSGGREVERCDFRLFLSYPAFRFLPVASFNFFLLGDSTEIRPTADSVSQCYSFVVAPAEAECYAQ